ncbi:MAG: Diaminopropionate ammonia-lyase, partial [uncultured Acetobacteraceae bacterium]
DRPTQLPTPAQPPPRHARRRGTARLRFPPRQGGDRLLARLRADALAAAAGRGGGGARRLRPLEGRERAVRPRLLQGAGRRLRGAARAGRRTGTAGRGALRHLGRPRRRQAQGGDARDHRDLRDRWQPRPQRRLGRAALRLPLRDLRPPGRQQGPARRHRGLRGRGPGSAGHLRRVGAGNEAGSGEAGLVRRLRHLLSGLHGAAARRDAGLSPHGGGGGRSAAGAADPRVRARRCGRARRRRLRADARALRQGRAALGRRGAGSRRLPDGQRRSGATHRRGRAARHRHGRARLRRAEPPRLAGAGAGGLRLRVHPGRGGGRLHARAAPAAAAGRGRGKRGGGAGGAAARRARRLRPRRARVGGRQPRAAPRHGGRDGPGVAREARRGDGL